MKTLLTVLSLPLLRTGFALTGCALASSACRSSAEDDAPPRPVPVLGESRPWTDAFLTEAVLIADEVRIEGPEDLLEHVAIRQDPEALQFATATTSEGLRQEVAAQEGFERVEIRCQLDAWTIVALRKLVVLQRPGEAPVRVIAAGDAAWVPVTGEEQRGPRLEFRGDRAPR
jgi:hypothetical protein